MHIMEGYLPPAHAAAWTAISAPFVVVGARRVARIMAGDPQAKLMLAASGAFAFVLSALKIPSVTGSCSHPTGVGLGSLLFGPPVMAALGTIVLVFQALLLAHGGLTTLGANVFSMAVAGPWVAWAVFRAVQGLGGSRNWAVFLGATLGDLSTYMVTALQLSLAFPDPAVSGPVAAVMASYVKFLGVYAFTQLPLAIIEGQLTVVAVTMLSRSGSGEPMAFAAGEHR